MLVTLFADENGQAFDDNRYLAVARSGDRVVEVREDEWIPMPPGSSLMVLPGRVPVGISKITGNFSAVNDRGYAVAALLPQGYTRTYLPAYLKMRDANVLPLFGYTAVAWHEEEERFYVAAVATESDSHKWQPYNYNTDSLKLLVDAKKKQFPNNRIIAQLAKCALTYSCFTAQNIFYERWEGGLPVSPVCNACCVGCISLQPSESCPSPQQRIKYIPKEDEVVEVMCSHLEKAPEGIISFGQGCEGEPLLQGALIGKAIQRVRQQCTRGTINANTNAGYTEGVQAVCEAGIDALRVSMISACPEHYHAYVRPKDFSLDDVKKSLEIARTHKVNVSLNWLTTPGVNDTGAEIEALIDLVRKYDIKQIQFRNLNLDPDLYRDIYPAVLEEDALGVVEMLNILKQELPGVKLGSFSEPHNSLNS